MRVQDIFTGEMLMTECNALRHYLKLGKKYLNNGDINRFSNMLSEASRVLDISPCCTSCVYDDIGYCGLRGPRANELGISLDEQYKNYCYPAIIYGWEKELEKYGKHK